MHEEHGPAQPPTHREPAPVAAESSGDAEQAVEPDEPGDDAIARLTEMVAGLMRDFDDFLPHLVAALDRNKAYDDISARLREAESAVAVRVNWALVDGAHRLLNDARGSDGLDENVRRHFVRQLEGMLRSAGVSEFWDLGADLDAGRHEPVDAAGEGSRHRVKAVHASGLERAGAVLKRAKVTVERYFADEPSRQGANSNG